MNPENTLTGHLDQQSLSNQQGHKELLKKLRISSSDRRESSAKFPWKLTFYALLLSGIAVPMWFGLLTDKDFSLNGPEVKNLDTPDSTQFSTGAGSTKTTGSNTLQRSIYEATESVGILASALDATGYVTARRQATVSSKITGEVAEIFVEEGDHVSKGALLARLDDRLLKAQYQLSQSQFAAAEASLLEPKVASIEAHKNLERNRLLFGRDLLSQVELDRAISSVDRLNAQITHGNKQIAVANKQMLLQEQRLLETEIRAPFSGVVISKAAQAGEIVSPISAGGGFTRTGICYLVDMKSLEIEVDVNESNINRVFAGQRVLVTQNSYRERQFSAQVITIIPSADRNRATVKVRIKLLENDSRILPNMGVKVSFLKSR